MKENFISDEIIQKISKFDSIIFDCDGVLVDIRKSYDFAINKTISAIMKDLFDENINDIINSKTLYSLKASGGFNDEVAVVYTAIMTLVASKKINIPFEKLIIDVIENSDESGINSIDSFFIKSNIDLIEIKNKLDYTNSRKESYIHRMFNQLFYGEQLYEKIFGEKSLFSEKPLIDKDEIVLDENLMSKLKNRFGEKISTVTGRGIFAFSYSLKDFLENFDIEHSVFLEDRSFDLAKPNPDSLIESISGINSKCVLYVGDSMEDLKMVEKCKEKGLDVSFCGIYGSSDEPESKFELFKNNNASFILESIQGLPKALNLV
tara:strand:- start:4944 stop:5903 length:960 start_codon:yes stop_codon:yes gene_type:complete